MSGMDIDQPLDSLVKANKSGRGRRSGVSRGRNSSASESTRRSGAAPASGGRVKYSGSVPSQTRQSGAATALSVATSKLPSNAGKIIVSGLPEDVTEPQIKELFAETIGPIKLATLAFNSRGKSIGTATIEFRDPKNAGKAFQQYNGRMIDGRAPMKVEVVLDPSKRSLNERLGPAPPRPADSSSGPQRSVRGGRGGGPATRSSGRGGKRPTVTAEQLDAELEQWNASSNSTAAAA